MIGLGAKYLTAAGFGRYRITAASLGKLDLLGTLGGWLTKATKQAILGAFGDDGLAVIKATNAYLDGIAASDRDKATALAGWLNTYAIEDAHIVYSLVPTLNVDRWLVGDGSAWINTNMNIYSDIGYEIKADCTGTSYGARLMGASNNSSYYAQVKWVSGNRYHVQTGGGTTEQFFTVGTEADILVDGGSPTSPATVTINGTVVSTTLPRVNPMILMNPFYIFAMNTGSTAADKAKCKIAKVALWSATMDTSKDNPYAWFVPFIRNNVNGMLDLIGGTFYANAGSGSFTISETPSTP